MRLVWLQGTDSEMWRPMFSWWTRSEAWVVFRKAQSRNVYSGEHVLICAAFSNRWHTDSTLVVMHMTAGLIGRCAEWHLEDTATSNKKVVEVAVWSYWERFIACEWVTRKMSFCSECNVTWLGQGAYSDFSFHPFGWPCMRGRDKGFLIRSDMAFNVSPIPLSTQNLCCLGHDNSIRGSASLSFTYCEYACCRSWKYSEDVTLEAWPIWLVDDGFSGWWNVYETKTEKSTIPSRHFQKLEKNCQFVEYASTIMPGEKKKKDFEPIHSLQLSAPIQQTSGISFGSSFYWNAPTFAPLVNTHQVFTAVIEEIELTYHFILSKHEKKGHLNTWAQVLRWFAPRLAGTCLKRVSRPLCERGWGSCCTIYCPFSYQEACSSEKLSSMLDTWHAWC